MIGFDVVHLAAGAVWLGGLAGLVVVASGPARRRPSWRDWSVRFSTVAVCAVVVVAGAGLAMTLIVLPSLDDLVSTGYGLALLIKVVLVAVVVVLGAYNRRRSCRS